MGHWKQNTNQSLARIGILMRIETPCNVRKRQHQYPEFGHTQGEIQKTPAKKYISIQLGVKLRKPSILMVPEFHPVFLFS
jgi:hypothetical protein